MSNSMWQKIIKHCNSAYPKECGGMLIGTYSKNLKQAMIKDIYSSKDNLSEKYSLLTDSKKENEYLKKIWKRSRGNKFFIGTWHSHPNGNLIPSNIDEKTLLEISRKDRCECPRVILIIVAGSKRSGWIAKVLIYTKERYKFELKKDD